MACVAAMCHYCGNLEAHGDGRQSGTQKQTETLQGGEACKRVWVMVQEAKGVRLCLSKKV